MGRFKVVNRLGSGGMGALLLAHDPAIDRMLAIKVLREGLDDEELRARFAREARSAGRLRHPNIVTIFDVGEHEGQPFIAMEYVPGETVAALIQRQARLPLSRKIKLLEELCDGLAYAHRNGLVHRDVKPANLMVDAEGMLKILDFGIVRVAESGMTQKDALVGTVPYMSPEQVGSGRPVDQRSDIFAVGDVAYELLSGRQAFPGTVKDGIFDRIKTSEPAPLAELCPALPPDLVRVVAKAMEKDPDLRYQDLAAMRNDLMRIREKVQREEEQPAAVAEAEGPTMPGGRAARPGTARRPPSTVRPLERESVAKRRASLIAQHLEKAKQALEAHEFEQAIAAAEDAALLDPGSEAAQQLVDEANRAIQDRQVQQWLSTARDHLNRGEPTLAAEIVDRALALKPDSQEAQSVHRTIEEVRQELELARERAQVVLEAVERARASLSEGAYEVAIRAADEALARQADHPEAVDIRAEAVRLLEEVRRKAAHDAHADDAISAARREFQAKEYDKALATLEEFEPPHERVSAALGGLRRQIEAIRAAEEEARRQKIAALAAAAHQAADTGKYDQALGILGRIRELDAASEIASSLTKEVLRRKAEAEQAARRRQKAMTAARRSAEALDRHDLVGATQALKEALDLDPQNPDALPLQRTIEEQQGRLADHLQRARQALAAEQVQDALQELAGARAIHPAEALLLQLDAEAKSAQAAIDARIRLREQQEREARERKQREEREAEERRAREQREAEERKEQAARAAEERRLRERQEAEAKRRQEQLEAEERRRREELEAEHRRRHAELEAEQRRAAELQVREEAIAKGLNKARRRSPEAALAILRPLLDLVPAHAELNARIREHQAALEQRIPAGASERATARSNVAYLALAAVAVLALGGGIWLAVRDDPVPSTQAGVDPSTIDVTPAPGPPPVTPVDPAPEPDRAVAPPAVQPPAATGRDAIPAPPEPQTPGRGSPAPPPNDAAALALEKQVAAIRQLARQQFESRQVVEGLATAQRGLKIKADDPEIRRLLDAATASASAEAATARNEATAADAPTAAAAAFERASQRLRTAESHHAGHADDALPDFWAARDAFREAASQGRAAQAAATEKKRLQELALKEELDRRAKEGRGAGASPNAGVGAGRAGAAPSEPSGSTATVVKADPRDAIHQTLRAYERAYSSMNVDELQRVWALSGTQIAQLRAAFNAARQYQVQVQVQDLSVAPEGRRATVSAQVLRAVTPRGGGGRNQQTVTNVFTLEQRGDAWVIVDVKAR